MTEQDWWAATDPKRMLDAAPADPRKFRLFAVRCCRQLWGHLLDRRSRHAVAVAERLANGQAPEAERAAAAESAVAVIKQFRSEPALYHSPEEYAAALTWMAVDAARE